MNEIVVTEGLSKDYGKLHALTDVSLAVPRGALFGLLGANGAGKTTMLDLLLNLQEPTRGKARVLGTDSRRLRGPDFTRIGYVSESQRGPRDMRLGYFFNYLKPFYPNWDDDRAAELLDRYCLPLDRRIRALSRGMWMKACLASSLAYRPELLVLDEPFSGLDVESREELSQTLVEAAEETTVVISTHDHGEIESFITHIAVLSEGRLAFAEEMAHFVRRIREVVVTLEHPFVPDPWPSHWICPESSASVTRFIDTGFDDERSEREIAERFEGVRDISAQPMPLRSILLALSRSQRIAA